MNNVGPWSATNAHYRKAKCENCSEIVRSKRKTMQKHVTACKNIEKNAKDMYLQNQFAFGMNQSSVAKSSTTSIKNFFQPKVGNKHAQRIELQIIRALIATNTSFNACALRGRRLLNSKPRAQRKYAISGKQGVPRKVGEDSYM